MMNIKLNLLSAHYLFHMKLHVVKCRKDTKTRFSRFGLLHIYRCDIKNKAFSFHLLFIVEILLNSS